MRLLEREAQLSSLLQYAEEAAGGARPAGPDRRRGRRRQVHAARPARGTSSPDARWCWGACDGLFTPRPLAPVLDIARQLGGELASCASRRAARPTVRRPAGRARRRPTAHRAGHRGRALGRRGDPRPAAVPGRGSAAPALILVTYRDDGLAADDPLRVAVGELSTQRSTRRMSLPRLSERRSRRWPRAAGSDPASCTG